MSAAPMEADPAEVGRPAPTPTTSHPELSALTGLRGIAAFWVVLTHFWGDVVAQFSAPFVGKHQITKFTLAGNLAVEIFFILSGFVLTYIYADALRRPTLPALKTFWRHRFARIYPVHFVMVLVFVGFGKLAIDWLPQPIPAFAISPERIVRNLLFLHTLPGSIAIDPPAWTLAPEVAAYIVFPLLAIGLVRIRRSSLAFALAAALTATGCWVVASTFTEGFYYFTYQLSWLRIAWAFPVGCLLACGWMLLGSRRSSRWWDAVAIAGIVGLLGTIVLSEPHFGFFIPVTAYPFLGLIVVGAAGATGIVQRVLSSKPLLWAGLISYSVYMTHFLVMLTYDHLLRKYGIAESPVLRLAGVMAALVAVVAIGAAVHYLVEAPARKLLAGPRT